MNQDAPRPTALSIDDLARLLTAASGRTVTADQIREDIDTGAPAGRDGRVNLVHYAAWLASEQRDRVP
jgi:hypothetical protein